MQRRAVGLAKQDADLPSQADSPSISAGATSGKTPELSRENSAHQQFRLIETKWLEPRHDRSLEVFPLTARANPLVGGLFFHDGKRASSQLQTFDGSLRYGASRRFETSVPSVPGDRIVSSLRLL